MTATGWFITADPGEFLAEVGEFLCAEPARNTVVLTVTENLRVKPPAPSPSPAPAWHGPRPRPRPWHQAPARPRPRPWHQAPARMSRCSAGGGRPPVPAQKARHHRLGDRRVPGLARHRSRRRGRDGARRTRLHPPGLRGRGYAGAATTAVSQAALNTGVREVVLYTDLADPASNALYQRLGYRPVEDRVVFCFRPAIRR